MFGDDSSYIVFLFLFTIFYAAFFFSTYHFFFEQKEKSKLDLKKIIHTVLIATLLAVFIRLGGVQDAIPDFVISIFALLGGMTIPLIILLLLQLFL